MPVYNVLVPVVALIEAATEQDAIKALQARLRSHGEEPYEFGNNAFESEPDPDNAPAGQPVSPDPAA